MTTVSAFLQTHTHNDSNHKALATFRQFHPDSDITIYSDNGEDFSDFAKEFSANFLIDTNSADPRGALDCDKLSIYIDRIKQHCIRTTSDYVVILEDDVMTYKTISLYPVTECAGPRIIWYSKELNKYLQHKLGSNISYGYGMCGGSIFLRDKFLDSLQVLDELKSIYELDSRICKYSDVGLTLLFQLSGFSYSIWQDVSEKFHADPMQRIFRDAALDHNDKRLYQISK